LIAPVDCPEFIMARPARFVLRCALALLGIPDASATPLGTALFGYGAMANGTGGYDDIRFPPIVTLGPLEANLRAGTFLAGDYSTEYAIDENGNFVAVDTTTAGVSQIGFVGFTIGSVVSIAADPTTNIIYGIITDVNSQVTSFFSIDALTGTATLIGPIADGIQSIAVDSIGVFYQLNRGLGAIVAGPLGGQQTVLGPLGIELNDTSTIAVQPGADLLFLVQFEASAGTNEMYVVDTSTGSATLVGPLGGDAPISAVALAPPLPDTIFGDGFD
jgi:hypothetical protein